MASPLVPTRTEELADAHLVLAQARRMLGDARARLGAASTVESPPELLGVLFEVARVARIVDVLLDETETHLLAAS